MNSNETNFCSRAVTVALYVILAIILFRLICDVCANNGIVISEYFTPKSDVVIEYYKRETCPWCVKFDNSNVFNMLKKQFPNVTFKILEVSQHRDQIPASVTSFPTFYAYRAGKFVSMYSGNRDFASMAVWVNGI